MRASREAVHEGSHAVTAEANGDRTKYTTIMPTEDSVAHTRHYRRNTDMTPAAYLVMTLAGGAGERLAFGSADLDAGDLEDARKYLRAYLDHGDNEALVDAHIRRFSARADIAVREHAEWIERVAIALDHHGTLSGIEVRSLRDGNWEEPRW